MSWCRWSCDINGEYSSDLYIYDSVNDCITVHVAGRRRTNYADNPYKVMSWMTQATHDDKWIADYIANGTLRDQWFDDHDSWEDLPEAWAGKNYDFGYDELDAFREFLWQARAAGINFPDYIFDYIDEELNNEQPV